MDYISVKGARQHNLKNIDVMIPKHKFVVFTGVSGSGKSSLAFDTIYAEGQRRYVESLSTYARQFLGIMGKPDVDAIEGLSPAISIDQKTVSHNPRSTVGTVTEIYDYLRLLFARVGHPHCPICGREIASQSAEQIVEGIIKQLTQRAKEHKTARAFILAPVVKDRKGEFSALFENLKAKGYRKIRIDGHVKDLSEELVLIKTNKHTIEVIVDKVSASLGDFKDSPTMQTMKSRLTEAVEQALKLADGLVINAIIKDAGFEIPEFPREFEDHLYSEKFSCPVDNIQLPEIEPRIFSFNSPHGACPKCSGIGKMLVVNKKMIVAPELSVKEGGIVPYASIFEHDTWLSRTILTVCESYDINAHTPLKNLTEKQMTILLDGDGKEYKVHGMNRQGKKTYIYERWNGVVGELTRRHAESTSDYIRFGIEKYMTETLCDECAGARLKKESLGITIHDHSISEVTEFTISAALTWLDVILSGVILTQREKEIGKLIIKEIATRLKFLTDVGLEYLTLSRTASTLSGGESQRIRLASQIGSGLTGVLYVLDEPTIGLHPRDNQKLVDTLTKIRDLGNSVIVVEHDKDVMMASDHIFDFGPGAGSHGGAVVAQGSPQELMKIPQSLTGSYLSGKRKITFPKTKHDKPMGAIVLSGASAYNLKNLTVSFPVGKLIAVTGVSGSGKSTLVVETLFNALQKRFDPHSRAQGVYDTIETPTGVKKAILIDQSPIGRTPRSNPATYTKLFDLIRDIYAATREAKSLGFNKGRFSFNVKGGRCEVCEGQGKTKIEMQFMPDIWIDCEVCHGKRFNAQTLEVTYKGASIADVLAMTVAEALEFFHVYSGVTQKLETLRAVGLDYMQLGQSATTLSGGEAQRVKLASELARRTSGDTVYILDEPTTGLHFADLEKLMGVLKVLVSRGNTVVVVEHNLDVIKNADWIIDLGPEGGERGGNIVVEGDPKTIAGNTKSETGYFLKHELS